MPDSAVTVSSPPSKPAHPDNQSAAPVEKNPEKSGVTPANENSTQKKSVTEKTAKKNKPEKEIKSNTPERENLTQENKKNETLRQPQSADDDD